MGIFSYKKFSSDESKTLFADALAITTYSYHNLTDGFTYGYNHTGFGTKFPLTPVTTMFGNSRSQGIFLLPWNSDSEKAARDSIN